MGIFTTVGERNRSEEADRSAAVTAVTGANHSFGDGRTASVATLKLL
jgi:hypothetical protein